MSFYDNDDEQKNKKRAEKGIHMKIRTIVLIAVYIF